ncbi:hypothetical protein FOL47_001230 [Perkinsus chesapeaki]|uniref:Uncharacterized protein n=1 Tax=Perkinsus chesapeaki TaxID=330153 RepID=A0A7J6KT44_PERCH|nr:hypothetical protein FOL47_001230 [Perkinsus chesapeaki]
MVNMVENPPASTPTPVSQQIASAFGVSTENISILRHITNDEFNMKTDELQQQQELGFATVLAWRDYMEGIKNPPSQSTVPSLSASSGHSDEDPELVTARIVETVTKLPVPDGECYNGYQDRRSISWYLKEIQGTVRLYQLSARAEWLFLTNAFKPHARSALLKEVERDCGPQVWMYDFGEMVAAAHDYLSTKYRRSDDPSRYEGRIINIKQRNGESVFAYLDRSSDLVSQGLNCGLQLSEEQICNAYRRGLLSKLRKTANVQFSTLTRASKLASELSRFAELNPWVLDSNTSDKFNSAQVTTANNSSTNATDTPKYVTEM